MFFSLALESIVNKRTSSSCGILCNCDWWYYVPTTSIINKKQNSQLEICKSQMNLFACELKDPQAVEST